MLYSIIASLWDLCIIIYLLYIYVQASSDGYESSSHHLLGSNKKCADLHQDAPSTADSLSLNLQSTPVSNQDNVSWKDDRLNRPLNPSVMKQTERESTDLMLLSDPISNCSNSPVELLGNNSLENVNSVVRQDINSHITSLSLPDYDLREDDLPSPSASYTVVVDGDNHDARSGTAPHGEGKQDCYWCRCSFIFEMVSCDIVSRKMVSREMQPHEIVFLEIVSWDSVVWDVVSRDGVSWMVSRGMVSRGMVSRGMVSQEMVSRGMASCEIKSWFNDKKYIVIHWIIESIFGFFRSKNKICTR